MVCRDVLSLNRLDRIIFLHNGLVREHNRRDVCHTNRGID